MATSLLLVFQLMIVGAFGTEWSVKYNQREICALKGSTVFMNGTYTLPERLTGITTFWMIDPAHEVEPTDMSEDPDFSGRVEYFTDEQKHFSLKLSDVMKKDEHQYCFRIRSSVEGEKWLGKPGIELRITELHVETPGEVTEGETAVLTCKTTCSLTDPTFIWYKNGRPLTTKTIKNNQLHLQTVSSEDAGSYSCAVRGYQHLNSTAQNLRVRRASGTKWSVKYNQQEICALKGSTVFMNGTYTHPEHLTGITTFWMINPAHEVEPTDMSEDPDFSGRVEYFTDEQKHFSLKLSDVMKRDEHHYCLRIRSSVEGEKWLGKPGIELRVTELHVETPEEVTEGETADLTCKTTCSLTDPTFIWYKNGRPLTTKTIKNNQLHLQTVSSEDAGSYSCAVVGYEHLNSTAHNLRVRYSPKSVSVSISPSGEIVEGSSVTLTCSSDANPPGKIYSWFKGSTSVGEGKTYSIHNIRSEDSGEYTCQSQNEHGQRRSTAVHLNVAYPPKNVSVSISPSGEIVEGHSVTLTCNNDGYPPVKNYTWFKEGGTSPVGSGHSYSPLQSGSYYCEAQNEHGSLRSAPVAVILKGYSTILYVAVGVGLCGITTFLFVVFWRRRKKQDGNTDEYLYVNVDSPFRSPDDDASSDHDYENTADTQSKPSGHV